MSTRIISLAQQYKAVNFALTRQRTLARGGSVKGLRGRSTEEYDCERLQSVLKTLNWLMTYETEIKAYLACPSKTAREAGLATAVEIERKQAIAAAGGPKR